MLYDSYRDRAAIYVVYIAEAHSVDGWQMPSNEAEDFCVRQPVTFEERCAAGRLVEERLKLTVPTLVDGMDNTVSEAFAAWPERIYIIGTDGRVAYKGAPGPRGFRVHEAATALDRVLGAAAGVGVDASTGGNATGSPFPPVVGLRLQRRRGTGRPVTEMEDVVDVRQEPSGNVYARTVMGEERILTGAIGSVAIADGSLVLVDSVGQRESHSPS